jgi:hypothetical protein
MPALTRRRYTEYRDECWHIYYGDVHVGTIAIRVGIPPDEDPWGWICGFYPGSHPGEHEGGTAATFEGPGPNSKMRGGVFCRNELRPISKNGGMPATGRRANMPCGKLGKGCRPRSRIR